MATEQQVCPLCGNDITEQREHTCPETVDDPSHEHRFEASGACKCGMDVYKAVRLAAEAALASDVPAASTACRRCDAPITAQQRLASGMCDECMALAMTRVPRPALVLNADALKVCTQCGLVFDSLALLDAHRNAEHARMQAGRKRPKRLAKLAEEAVAARVVQDRADLALLSERLDGAIRGMQEVTRLAREALARRGVVPQERQEA